MRDLKRCLLLLDLQNEFVSAAGNFPTDAVCQQALLENVGKATQAFRDSGDAMVWVLGNVVEAPPSPTFRSSTAAVARPGCHENVVFRFTDTTLRDDLTAENITDVYVGGLLTNVCVCTTAEVAHAPGFTVMVLDDCLGWRKYKSHQTALRCMREAGFELRHGVRH
ncbi:Isochorismatase-like protein [Mycena alexandri]|uniref:Isochorismatase-like protein n=1 Tax=Mycena alexandri TaxID=1745969 RepID=A0AAD6T949_9AGAR|nr:Isochorismatase-like protein [Mycena alexandri]